MPRSAVKVTKSLEAHVQDLHRCADDLETKLNASAKKHSGDDDKANRFRLPLCQVFVDVMLADPASSFQRDTAGRLWRLCFYTRISPWRLRNAKDKRKRVDCRKSEQGLAIFIAEGVTLYNYLIEHLQAKLEVPAGLSTIDRYTEGGSTSLSQSASVSASTLPPSSTSTVGVVPLLAACHIHLGDLFRYSLNFSQAEAAYHTAATLAPGLGHAFNQLAVVCQLKEDQQGSPLSAVALYWYTRSLLVVQDPFVTAKTNLARLLASNEEWVRQQQKQTPARAIVVEKSKSVQVRHFLAIWVDLQYRFFLGVAADQQSQVLEQMASTTERFRTLVDTSAFGDSLLCRMVVVHAFSECFLDRPHGSPTALTMVLARTCTYQVGLALAARVLVGLAKLAPGKLPSSVRLLLPVLLVAEYTSALSMPSTEEVVATEAMKDARDGFWKALVDIWNKLAQLVAQNSSSTNIILPGGRTELFKDFEIYRDFGPFSSFVPPCENGHLSEEETLSALVRKKEPVAHETASTGMSSAGGGAASDQGRLRIARHLQLAQDLAADEEGSVSKFIQKDVKGNYFWLEEESASDDMWAEDESAVLGEEKIHAMPAPMGVEGEAKKQDEDVLMYKADADGGMALLVPGALLQQTTVKEVTTKATEPPRPAVHSANVQEPRMASSRLPGLNALPVHEQAMEIPLTIPQPPDAFMGTITNPLFDANPSPGGVRLPPGLHPAPMAGTPSLPGLLPPPGFQASSSMVAPVGDCQPETIADAMRLYGNQMTTANPFATPSLGPPAGPPGFSNHHAFGLTSFPATESFLGGGHDPLSEGSSLLDAGLLNSLWMNDPNNKSKNPFAT
jgi:hypothetical protein